MTVGEFLGWIDVNGSLTDLSDPTTYYAEGPLPPQGQHGVPLQIISHAVPLMPGTREQYVQVDANDIRFPIIVFGETQPEMEQNIRALSESLRPSRGVGQLLHQAVDGTQRVLNCREVSRLRDVPSRGVGWTRFNLEFSAADPYWYDTVATTISFSPSGPVTFFQNPFLPIHLAAGGLSSSFSISNSGQDIAWPVWTITGPGTNPVLTNATTGQVLTIAITLTAGQVLTVDTRPRSISVSREDGSNQWATVSDVAQMWGFAVGNNAITLSMGSTTGASLLAISYTQCYEGV